MIPPRRARAGEVVGAVRSSRASEPCSPCPLRARPETGTAKSCRGQKGQQAGYWDQALGAAWGAKGAWGGGSSHSPFCHNCKGRSGRRRRAEKGNHKDRRAVAVAAPPRHHTMVRTRAAPQPPGAGVSRSSRRATHTRAAAWEARAASAPTPQRIAANPPQAALAKKVKLAYPGRHGHRDANTFKRADGVRQGPPSAGRRLRLGASRARNSGAPADKTTAKS